MRRAALPVLAWAALLSVLAVVLWIWTPDDLPPAVFSGAAALVWAVGLYVLIRPGLPALTRAVPELSLSSVLVAVAVAMLALAALVGVWLLYIGVGALLLGLVGLARELVAERRAR